MTTAKKILINESQELSLNPSLSPDEVDGANLIKLGLHKEWLKKQEEKLEKKMKKNSVRSKYFYTGLTFIIVAGVIGTGSFLFMQHKRDQRIINNPSLAGKLEADILVKKVSRLIILPADEQPTVATVNDYTKLKNQPFFKNAGNGDKVLIYAKNKTAILYDPQANKLLSVAPLNIGEANADQPQRNN